MVQSVGGEGSADTGVQWLGGRANPVVRAVHMCTGSLFVVSGLAAAPAIDDDLGAGTLGDEVRLRTMRSTRGILRVGAGGDDRIVTDKKWL
jgi:hypothetical protein